MVDAPQITEEQRKALEEKIKSMTPEQLKEFQKQQCIFCQIAAGKVPAKKIHEDEKCIAVLDIMPAAKGHLLLVPREHYAIMPQVPDELLGHLSVVARKLSQLLLKSLKVEGTNIFMANGMAAGQKSQHFLIHIIPRREGDMILELNEKFIDIDMQRKVQLTIEKKLNELLGLQKDIVAEEDVKPEVEEKEVPEEESPEDEEKEASEEDEEKEEESKKEEVKPEVKPKKKVTKKKEIKKEDNEEADKEDSVPKKIPRKGEVSLDDIADLFK